MGFILLVSVILYSAALRKNGVSWKATCLSSLILFIVARLLALVSQITPALIFGAAPNWTVAPFMVLIPAAIYLILPVLALKKKWFLRTSKI